MVVSSRTGKVPTRGQKLIYEENVAVLKGYGTASIISSTLYFVVSFFFFTTSTWEWVAFGFSVVCQFLAVYTMFSASKCIRNEKGHVIDAGVDLNESNELAEFCKDVVISTSVVFVLARLWWPFFFLLFWIPVYPIYKFWTLFFL